jgi:YesN/AraC family two-component response regulator
MRLRHYQPGAFDLKLSIAPCEGYILPKYGAKHILFTDRAVQAYDNSGEKIAERLSVQMVKEKAFLRQGYSIRDLAESTGIRLNRLSAFINQRMGCGFNDYLNKFRITHCLELIQAGRAELLTLQALAAECGFTNRNTFIVAFKKFTGHPPSLFIKKMKASHQP